MASERDSGLRWQAKVLTRRHFEPEQLVAFQSVFDRIFLRKGTHSTVKSARVLSTANAREALYDIGLPRDYCQQSKVEEAIAACAAAAAPRQQGSSANPNEASQPAFVLDFDGFIQLIHVLARAVRRETGEPLRLTSHGLYHRPLTGAVGIVHRLLSSTKYAYLRETVLYFFFLALLMRSMFFR